MTIEAPGMAGELSVGESVAVDGACLTVEKRVDGGFVAFATGETLERTTLGGIRAAGRAVNLERALRLGDRLGGHLVMGHVDGVGELAGLEPRDEGWWLRVAAPAEILEVSVRKGSIAVDGVSLTLVDLTPSEFTVAVIPETYKATTMRLKEKGDPVNLESDMIGKYVARSLKAYQGSPPSGPGPGSPLDLLMGS